MTNGAEVDQNRQTSCDGIFACGNVLHVHDLVDYVSEEAEIAGKAASEYIKGGFCRTQNTEMTTDKNIRYTVPQRITDAGDVKVYFRVGNVMKKVTLNVYADGKVIYTKKMPKAAPGEMISVPLKGTAIKGAEKLYFEMEETK